MPIFNNQLAGAAGSAGGAGDFKIERSLRFSKEDGAHFSKTYNSAGNQTKWTWSSWIKRTAMTNNGQSIFSVYTGANSDAGYFNLHFNGSNQLDMGGWHTNYFRTARVFRDPAAWMHICVAYDRSLTDSNRIKVFVNGVRETSFDSYNASATATYPLNSASLHNIAANAYYTNNDGKLGAGLAEVHFLDGGAPGTATDNDGTVTGIANAEYLTDFGEFDATTRVWNPKEFSGSHGTNGFYLKLNPNTTGNVTYSNDFASQTGYYYLGSRIPSRAFDGSLSTTCDTENANNWLEWTPTGGYAYTSSVEVYTQQTSGTYSFNGGSATTLSSPNQGWNTVATGSGTITSVKIFGDSSNYGAVSAFRVDGKIVIDEKAIGYDSSGSENHWTVNNLEVGTTYTHANSITSSNTRGSVDYILNGLTDYDTTMSNSGTGAWIEFNPPGGIAYSRSVEVMANNDPNDNMRLQLNGGSLVNTVASNAYVTLATGSGTINKIRLQGDTSLFRWRAIRVDGVVLKEVTSGNDSVLDSPTNYEASSGNNGGNYATLNPFSVRKGTLSNGNLRFVANPDSSRNESTIAVTSGKYYWEAEAITNMQTHTIGGRIGICQSSTSNPSSAEQVEFDVDWHANAGIKIRRAGQSSVSAGSGTNYDNGDLIGVALDADNNIVKFYKNGTLAYTVNFSQYITPGSVPLAAHSWGYFSSTWEYNFGQRPFVQTVPTGYKSLCTTNLDDPLISNPSEYFDVATFTGNAGTQKITGARRYSNEVTGTAFSTGYGKDRAFNGDLDARAFAQVGAANLVFTPSPAIPVSTSLRLRIKADTSGNSGVLSVNGVDYSSSVSTGSNWITIPNVSSLTEIQFGKSVGNGSEQSSLAAVEVDGTILVDGYGGPGFNFSPDLVWLKSRSTNDHHGLFDTQRGPLYRIASDYTYASTSTANTLTSFDSDGFTIGSSSQYNGSGGKVAWAWDAGSSNTQVSAGSLTSSAFNTSQTWSSAVTSSTGFRSNEPATNGFDNSTSTICSAVGSGLITFAPSGTFPSTSTIRIYLQGSGSQTVTVNGGSGQTITGNAWQTVAFTNSSASSFTLTIQASGGVDSGFRALEINGAVLVDSGTSGLPTIPTIPTIVRANPTSGFSIITWTGNQQSSQSIAHGLSSPPKLLLLKDTSNPYNWYVITTATGSNLRIEGLNNTNGAGTITEYVTDSNAITNLSNQASLNTTSATMLIYAFSPVEGYSAIGSYESNGISDGPFVYTGFRPKWIMIRHTGSGENWAIFDTDRDPNNDANIQKLTADEANQEATQSTFLDILSNGFKLRSNASVTNDGNDPYMYLAFAEHPFKTARAR